MANKIPKLLKSDAAQSIRNEVLRFESVHPNIYAIYEILDHLDDADVSQVIKDTIKDYVVSIEDSFVNSQEWTLPRFVNVLKLGIVGSVTSGKSALVHRYLTGSYIQDESPEGGRFKKEVVLDGLSSLVLIRDEGGCPDKQLSLWADGVIFVFSLEKEESLEVVNDYYQQMSTFRSMTDVPVLLVGTQDAISDSNPRVIDDSKARRMASNLGRAVYYETCATYGLNVERVFLDVCSRMLLNSKPSLPIANNIRSRPTTPQVHTNNCVSSSPYPHGAMTQPKRSCSTSNDNNNNFTRTGSYVVSQPPNYTQPIPKEEEPVPPPLPARPDNMGPPVRQNESRTRVSQNNTTKYAENVQNSIDYEAYLKSLPSPRSNAPQHQQSIEPNHVYSEYNMLMSSGSSFIAQPPTLPASSAFDLSIHHRPEKSTASSADGIPKDPPTPGSTPTQIRKTRRKSHLFKPHSDKDSNVDKSKQQLQQQQQINGIGSGRLIPVKQNYLFKKSSNQINKDRKNRKYVTLTEDAKLTYYPNMNDYMNQVRGKEVDLKLTSIKIPGVPYRNSCLPTTPSATPQQAPFQNMQQMSKSKANNTQEHIGPTLVSDSMTTAYLIDHGLSSVIDCSSNSDSRIKDSSVRNKRHRRMKSNPKVTNDDDQESYEFILIGNDNRQWHFDAGSLEERDDWVMKIESLILLQLQVSSQNGFVQSQDSPNDNSNNINNNLNVSIGAIANLIRSIAGNEVCCDCGSPDPCWASLNLGISVCIECSGVHRQLGTHLSRVRSFQLDEWSKEHIAVMQAIGNTLANSVWEASVHASSLKKPEADSSRADKEAWVRAKYEKKMFLPPLPYLDAPIQQQLIDAITRQDTRQVILCLALAEDAVNACYSDQDPRTAIHIAATLGNIVYLQLLLWYNGNPDVTDNEGRNASFYAYFSGQVDCALFLIKNSCSPMTHPMLSQCDENPSSQSRSQTSCLTMNPQQQSSHVGHSIGATLPRRRNNVEPLRFIQKSQMSANSPILNYNNNNNHAVHENAVPMSGVINNNNYIDYGSSVFHNGVNSISTPRGHTTLGAGYIRDNGPT